MNLSIEHNLNNEQLRKALAGIAIGSGIEPEMIETLQKSCACDNSPKLPRTRAMRELYRSFQEQFREANADIERYAVMIAKGELRKAGHQAPLTAEQLQRLLQAIQDRYGYLAAQIQSVDYEPLQNEIDRWKTLGLVDPAVTPATFMASVPAEMHLIRNAFIFGRLTEALEEGKSYAEMMRLAVDAPLLLPDLHAVAVAEQQTALYLRDNAADLATKVGQLAIKQRNETIRQMAVEFHSRTLPRTILDREEKEAQEIATPTRYAETWQEFKSELHQVMTDKSRDWERVAYTELTDAQKQGTAHQLLAEIGPDGLVFKVPMESACPQCKFLYLLEDQRTPRVFKLSQLVGNGNNVGRKTWPIRGGQVDPVGRPDGAEELKAVAGTVHPFCQCQGPYEYLPGIHDKMWEKKE